jgi:hypothetical protein
VRGALGKDGLLPIMHAPINSMVRGSKIVQKTSDGIPHLLRGPTLPKSVQHSLVLARTSYRARDVNIARNFTTPDVACHGLVPHLPHQNSLFLLSFMIPHFTLISTCVVLR